MSRLEELIRRRQAGDREAADLLVAENAGLIWSVAKRFLGRGADAEDLYQLGCLGFLKAVDGFDLEFGTQFSTYAVPKISGEIRRFLRDDGAIKVSRSIKERSVTIRQIRARLSSALGREPSLRELSEHTGYTPEEIAAAEAAVMEVESIHRECGEEGFTLENILTDTESEERLLEKIALRQAITELPERERTVIQLRYFHGLTQDRIARVLGVSQVQVSRIEKKAIGLLREKIG
jgi:RNA polymerase sporulation-specific sigma factor